MSPLLTDRGGTGQVSPGHFEPCRKCQCLFPPSFSGTWEAHLHALWLRRGEAGMPTCFLPHCGQKLRSWWLTSKRMSYVPPVAWKQPELSQHANPCQPTDSLAALRGASPGLAWRGGCIQEDEGLQRPFFIPLPGSGHRKSWSPEQHN